jgi:kynurenine formamidase
MIYPVPGQDGQERARGAYHVADLLADAPRNWRRWGNSDEVGALNFLTSVEVVRAAAAVQQGTVFTLGLPTAGSDGEPVWPGRAEAQRYNTRDRASYASGRVEPFTGGVEYADDVIVMFLQGTTHVDALGHVWYENELYNGYAADETVDHISSASVLPIAERGIVGRGVLIDMARHRGKPRLERNEAFRLEDVLAAAMSQHVEIEPHDILLIRTGWLQTFYDDRAAFYAEPFLEPGLMYEPAVADWFHRMEICLYGTDTVGNELTQQPGSGAISVLHASLMRNLGVIFLEMLRLEELAAHCDSDGRWAFMFVAAPLKIVGGTGSPVNPIAIK